MYVENWENFESQINEIKSQYPNSINMLYRGQPENLKHMFKRGQKHGPFL